MKYLLWLGLMLLTGPVQAKVVVSLLPAVQFVRQGGSVLLKARASGNKGEPGWQWTLQGPGQLAPDVPGRVRFLAEGVAPWTQVRIRASSLEDPAATAEAAIEVLPSEVFGVLEQVLGRGWIASAAERPEPARLTVAEPGWFSWSGGHTLTAEVDSFEADRFTWKLVPNLGWIYPKDSRGGARECKGYDPPTPGAEPVLIRIQVSNLENPEYRAEAVLVVPERQAYQHPVDYGLTL